MATLGKRPVDHRWPCLPARGMGDGRVPIDPRAGKESKGLCSRPGCPDSRVYAHTVKRTDDGLPGKA